MVRGPVKCADGPELSLVLSRDSRAIAHTVAGTAIKVYTLDQGGRHRLSTLYYSFGLESEFEVSRTVMSVLGNCWTRNQQKVCNVAHRGAFLGVVFVFHLVGILCQLGGHALRKTNNCMDRMPSWLVDVMHPVFTIKQIRFLNENNTVVPLLCDHPSARLKQG